MTALLARIRREERGSVLIIVAGFLPIAVLLAAWVIDLGNGAEHRRHLQLQADAGALAASQEFIGCRKDPEAANAAIRDAAIEYAASQNVQVGGDDAQDRVKTVINGTGYDAEDNSDGEPCETGFVDVKLTEEDSPAFFGFVGSNDWHAHARVQVFKLQRLRELLPVAVPVPDPSNAAAIFVDETTGLPLKDPNGNDVVAPLAKTGNEDGLAIWETADAAQVPITAAHVGVRIALSGGSSTTCGDPGVACYDDPNGLAHIQGWSATGTVTQNPPDGPQGAPLVRSVRLIPGSGCEDPYFSSPSRTCGAIGVSAFVEFGGNPADVGGDLIAAFNGHEYDLTPDVSDPAGGAWTTGTVIPIPADTGPVDVELKWIETKGKVDSTDCAKNKNKPCEGTFGVVQRHFSATKLRSGPIERVELAEGATTFPNSLERCSAVLTSCTHGLDVKIGISGGLSLDGPPQRLRIDQGTSLTQALDCNADGPGNFTDEIVGGCTPWYEVNPGTACPANVSNLPQPWQCSQVTPGARSSQAARGLNLRILGAEKPKQCPPAGAFGHNNWDLNGDGTPDYQSGDPRIVYVFLTGFGAFDGQGADDTVPVTGFAAFYITAWKGQSGFPNPCDDEGDDTPDDGPLAVGEIFGHYISHVQIPNDGGGGEDPCDFDDIRPCTAVLVD